jgi:hypothetical protein
MCRERWIVTGLCAAFLAGAILGNSGCSRPVRANIMLRKEKQALQAEIESLHRQHEADIATIRELQSLATTAPALPQSQLQRLFTVHGLEFGRLTGGLDLNPDQPGDEGVAVYVVPTDQSGQPLKAAGAFVVEIFDLAQGRQSLIGHCDYDVDQARANWFGRAMLYTYVLKCHWDRPPSQPSVTVRVTFTDELTRRQFVAKRDLVIQLPFPTTQP